MSEAIVGNVFVRKFDLEKKCNSHQGHSHNYDHTTFVHRGKIQISYCRMEGDKQVEFKSKEFGEGEFVDIRADVYHTIKALEDDTVYYCIFSHRDFDGLVTQEYKGNAAANV